MRLIVLLLVLTSSVLSAAQPAEVRIKGLPGPLQWKNSPAGFDTRDNALTIVAGPSTDWYISPVDGRTTNHHLIAQNCCNFGFPVRGLAPGASVVNFHYAYPAAVQANYGLGKALSCDETGFLGTGDEAYRRQAWNFMLSGGGAFNNLDYSFTVGHEDGADAEPNGPGGGSSALRRQLRVLSRFLHSMSLADLAPDTRTVKHAEGAYARVLSAPGREYGMYFDGSGPIAVTLDLPAGEYSGEWVNTETGSVERLQRFRHPGGQRVVRTPEFRNGIALRLGRAQR